MIDGSDAKANPNTFQHWRVSLGPFGGYDGRFDDVYIVFVIITMGIYNGSEEWDLKQFGKDFGKIFRNRL